MAGTAFGLSQLASLTDPSIAVDQAALDRQMALAQALRQQAMSPIDTAGRQVGGMAYRISPFEGLAKLLQGYSSSKLDEKNDTSRLALAQRTAAALRGMDGQDQATPAGPQMSTPDNPQMSVPQASSAPAAGNGFTIANLLRGGMVNDIGGSAMGSAYAKRFEPTDFERTLRAGGIDPQSAIGKKLMQDQIAKQNNVPNESIRPGGYQRNAVTGAVTQFPQVPVGFQAVPDGQGGFKIAAANGGPEAVQQSATAQAIGKAATTPFAGVDVTGQPQPVQSVATALGYPGNGGPPSRAVPPAQQGARDVDRVAILKDELGRETDPQQRVAIQKMIDATQGGTATVPQKTYAAPPLGTEHAQKGLDTAWEGLKAQNREAQNTKSYLQNIVTAAEKGAIVGPGAERREMIQGILQLAGIKEDVNTNATSQTQLLNKYSGQIVARLGSQGAMGTDAARSLLASAYPGQHMNVDAIREAVGNLNGAQDMTQAKTRFLTEAGTKRDTAAYQQREIAFDQAADPRIWQYKAIRDPGQRKAFAQGVLKQDPTFPDRIKQLETLGAL